MPDVKLTGNQINDHVNNNPMTEHRPLTECKHEVPVGPATGKEDPRAHDPKPTDGKELWTANNKPHPKGGTNLSGKGGPSDRNNNGIDDSEE